MKRKPIYVEIPIITTMDDLWESTQTPHLHEQWDLRFSSITYLPKQENEPQKFTYATNIGFGKKIEGWGKSVGTFNGEDGSRTSSLHFGTEQKLSIISEGKGFWKYEPEHEHVKFLTQYDYKTNWGTFGALLDKLAFRPMIGWGTALSFDVLKRWLEKGETPASQYIRFFSSWLITLLFAFVWIFHGLVPKLLVMHPTEIAMTRSMMEMSEETAATIVFVAGIVEVMFGILWLFYRKKRQLFLLQLFVFPLLTISTLVAGMEYIIHPFTPLTFNSALIILSIVGFLVSKDVPSAKSCKRKREG
ncbi:hypothetical protein CIB95_08660 [Lottiidibacillus patelloidae]|uniref:DoxX-like family protein n=1 Tax=Lottiidibacillus patelloidae TaxID=2670334 RepID=A0A263BSZ1_9BACI|nr:DoxX-like family protein [Lottiidibacillus patelloidae]OZM56833.1 hypothetical protein CIB95_08660 [Lottiidibacillus patelloidae]